MSSLSRSIAFVVATMLAAAACVFLARTFRATGDGAGQASSARSPGVDLGTSPPEPDVTGLEPAVAAAIRTAHEAVRKQPGSAAAWGELGMVLQVHGLAGDAVLCYDRAARFDPSDYRWPYLIGIATQRTDSTRAIAEFRTAEKLKSGDAAVRIRLAEALAAAGHPDEAREQYDAASKLDPNCSHAWLGLAQAALQANDADRALELLKKAEAVGRRHGAVYAALARALRMKGEADLAAQADERASQLPPDGDLRDPTYEAMLDRGVSIEWRSRRGDRLFAAGKYDEAAEQYGHAVAAQPDSIPLRLKYAEALGRGGHYDKAATVYEWIIAKQADNVDGYVGLGTARCSAGRNEDGLDAFLHAMTLKPDEPAIRYRVYLTLLRLGRVRDALDALRSAIKDIPDDPLLLRTLAWTLSTHPDPEHRDGAEAVRHAAQACALTRFGDAMSLASLATAQAETGEFGQATVNARRALAIAESDPRAGISTGTLQEMLRAFAASRPYRDNPPTAAATTAPATGPAR